MFTRGRGMRGHSGIPSCPLILHDMMDHHTPLSIGGRLICNLEFADDIDFIGGSNGELQDLTNRLLNIARACKQMNKQKHTHALCFNLHEQYPILNRTPLKLLASEIKGQKQPETIKIASCTKPDEQGTQTVKDKSVN